MFNKSGAQIEHTFAIKFSEDLKYIKWRFFSIFHFVFIILGICNNENVSHGNDDEYDKNNTKTMLGKTGARIELSFLIKFDLIFKIHQIRIFFIFFIVYSLYKRNMQQ